MTPEVFVPRKVTIKQEKIIFVEGKDDKKLIYRFLDKLNISDCQVEAVEGKLNFNKTLPEISKLPGFRTIKKLGIIRDADNNANSALTSVHDIVKRKMNLTPPSQKNSFGKGNPIVGIFIITAEHNKGMLEDLCLGSQETNPAMKCIKEYEKCIKKLKQKPKNISKAKCLAYLGAMKEPVNNIGDAAMKGYWDFDSQSFKDLANFLLGFK